MGRLRRRGGDAHRNLLQFTRVPTLLVFSIIQPIMFVLLFRFVFGGAIKGLPPGISYVNYLLPGIFVQTAIFGSTQTGIGLATDLKSGLIDRFRSLPMARSAVLAGRTMSDFVRNIVVVLLMIGVGYLVGFFFDNGVPAALAAILLSALVGFSFSWVSATIGLAIKDVESVQAASFTWIFPLTFISSVFVSPASMPPLLQFIARNNPVTIWADSSGCSRLAAPPSRPARASRTSSRSPWSGSWRSWWCSSRSRSGAIADSPRNEGTTRPDGRLTPNRPPRHGRGTDARLRRRTREEKVIVLLTMCFALAMAMLDNTVVNVALPSIQLHLGAGFSELQWVVDGYVLAFASLLLTGGILGDRYGRKKIFLIGLVALFTIFSFMCGVSQTATQLILFRALQGVGGALIIPGTLSIITVTFPPQERAKALGIWAGVPPGIALALGPTLGGYMVEHLGWESACSS